MTETLAAESWRQIPGYEKYYASTEGQVRGPRGVLRGSPDRGGYLRLTFNYGYTKRSVHSLVALAFHGPRPDGAEVDHIDGDRRNNRPSNLRYVTRSENEKNKHNHGTSNRGERCSTARLTRDQVLEIRAASRERGERQKLLAARYGVTQSAISQIVTGRSWAWL